MGPVGDEGFVLETQCQDVVQHRRIEGDIGARLQLEVNVGSAGQLGAPWVPLR